MAKPRSPERRQLILDTALALFSERGFFGVSVNDIAKKAQIAPGSLYTYFTSKEQLVNELYRYWKQIFGTYIERDLADLTGRRAHAKIWQNLGSFIGDHQKPFLFLETQHHASYLDSASLDLEEGITGFAIGIYRERFGLSLSHDQAQLVISASFGSYIQATKDAAIGRLTLDQKTLATLEAFAWQQAKAAESLF